MVMPLRTIAISQSIVLAVIQHFGYPVSEHGELLQTCLTSPTVHVPDVLSGVVPLLPHHVLITRRKNITDTSRGRELFVGGKTVNHPQHYKGSDTAEQQT